jgi:hypothetical protein
MRRPIILGNQQPRALYGIAENFTKIEFFTRISACARAMAIHELKRNDTDFACLINMTLLFEPAGLSKGVRLVLLACFMRSFAAPEFGVDINSIFSVRRSGLFSTDTQEVDNVQSSSRRSKRSH